MRVKIRTKAKTRGRYTSKYDGYNRRIMIWVCKVCDAWHKHKKPSACWHCGELNFYFFASTAEAKRYAELKLSERLGEVNNIQTQVSFPLVVNGCKICTYVADFVYYKNGEQIIEDVKPNSKGDEGQTDLFKIKRRLLGATHGLKIQIVKRS